MTKRLLYKLGNMRHLASFCLFGIRLALSLFWGDEDGNSQEAVGRESITCLGKC